MREEIRYIADDSTEFEDEWECREYEWKLNLGNNPGFFLLDGNYKRLDPKESKSYEDVEYIYIPCVDAVRKAYSAFDCHVVDACRPDFLEKAWGWSGEFSCQLGLWAYDYDNETWFHLGQFIEDLTTRANKAMDAINGGEI